MIGIVDYGLGNIRAFENIYRRLGIAAAPVKTAAELAATERLILPGVGAFDWAMDCLTRAGMLDTLHRRVLEDRVPILGVCVGMQIMADGSDEGSAKGLGWIPGRVERFDGKWFNQRTHLPHMGWNDIAPVAGEPLFAGIEEPQYYFLHSYFFRPAAEEHAIARSQYGIDFASAVRRDNIWATQFHPEKSHDWGVALLKNFAGIA
ncbi:MAG: imidazole glycerol phosphate synthase subunit HisH [Sphingomonas sp.]|uniref:imidazole glycerol phosphate synthase subunit HisH n=1 Tax=Sphingomonas sp. TaxID=28214 RepID=UPI0025D535FD|nr:imidazole glycerol phosphate synthase subunit HisH [Sphingomonas sp.]MBX3565273.1 imidazole glycerol phosphate synthase subunit HisH [Sphingomonas sp.]